MRAWVASLSLCLAACAGHQGSVLRSRGWISDRVERQELLEHFARRLFADMVADRLRDSDLFDDQLSDLFVSSRAARLRVMRRTVVSPARRARGQYRPFRGTTFDSACVQGADVSSPRALLGLRASALTFDRVLVAGREPGGGRWAAWVEGTFMLTSEGFVLVQAARFEPPRRDHADLELAPCDLRVGRP